MAIIVQHNNPIAPVTAPSADEILNAYQAHSSAINGEAQQQEPITRGFNPFSVKTPKDDEDSQDEHLSRMEKYLAPIAMNHVDIESDYNDEKHLKFLKNIDKDPAFQEIADPAHGLLQQLKAGIDAGHITPEDAVSVFADYGQNVISPTLRKHGHHEDKSTYHDEVL